MGYRETITELRKEIKNYQRLYERAIMALIEENKKIKKLEQELQQLKVSHQIQRGKGLDTSSPIPSSYYQESFTEDYWEILI